MDGKLILVLNGESIEVTPRDGTYFLDLCEKFCGDVKLAFNTLIGSHIKVESRKTGIHQETLDNIDKVVKDQMALNATTQKTITVGQGRNAIEVKFEQRAITPKWIMNAAGCNQFGALEYIKLHESEINEHHEKVLNTNDTDFFNRRAGRASKRLPPTPE